jgi:hypothetical protein
VPSVVVFDVEGVNVYEGVSFDVEGVNVYEGVSFDVEGVNVYEGVNVVVLPQVPHKTGQSFCT